MRATPILGLGLGLAAGATGLAGLVFAALGAPGKAPVPAPAAHAAPASAPDAQAAAWPVSRLAGGPVYELALEPLDGPNAPDLQRLVAAGGDILSTSRGLTWTLVGGVPDAVNVVAGGGGTWLASSGVGGGLVTLNAGQSWSRSEMRGAADAVRFLAAAPDFADSGLAFGVTTDDLQPYRSNARGVRWTDVVIVRGREVEVGAVAFSPNYTWDETVFAGADAGIFVSTDSGQTWQPRAAAGPGVPAFGKAAGPLAFQGLALVAEWGDDPRRLMDPDEHTLFAWNASGAWRSDDDGATWTALRLPADVAAVHDLAVSPGWPRDRALLVAVAAEGAVGLASTDGGATWRRVPGAGGIAGTSAALARDFVPIPPKDPFPPLRTNSLGNEVFAPFLARSAPFPGPPAVPMSVHRQMHLATDGAGTWRSDDDGATWRMPLETQVNGQPLALAFLGDAAEALAAADAAGLYRSTDGGATWRRADGFPRGAGRRARALVASPAVATDRTVFAATDDGAWVSRDAGTTWARTPLAAAGPVRALAVSPNFATDGTVLAAGQRSTDGGRTWAPVEGLDGRPWTAVAFSPRFAADGLAWAATDEVVRGTTRQNPLWRSNDGGRTWSLVEAVDLANREALALVAFAVSPGEPVRVLVGTRSGLVQSLDAGATWKRSDGASTNEVRALDVRVVSSPFQTAVIVAATARGPIWSTDRGITWSRDEAAPRDVRAARLGPDARTILMTTHLGTLRHVLPPLAAAAR